MIPYVSPWSRIRDIRTEVSFCATQLKDFSENDLYIEDDGDNN